MPSPVHSMSPKMMWPDCSPAQAVAVGAHAGVHVLVAHRGGLEGEACLVERLEQAVVAHDGGHDRYAGEAAVLVEVHAAHVQDEVAIDHVAVFVHRDAAVGVAVVGKAHVQPCSTT